MAWTPPPWAVAQTWKLRFAKSMAKMWISAMSPSFVGAGRGHPHHQFMESSDGKYQISRHVGRNNPYCCCGALQDQFHLIADEQTPPGIP